MDLCCWSCPGDSRNCCNSRVVRLKRYNYGWCLRDCKASNCRLDSCCSNDSIGCLLVLCLLATSRVLDGSCALSAQCVSSLSVELNLGPVRPG